MEKENDVTLKEFFNDKIESIVKSIDIAYKAMDKRLDGMNEFRSTLKDQAARFVTREEMTLVVSRLENDIKNLQLAKAVLEGKASQSSVNLAFIISAIGIMIGIVSIIIKFI